MEISNKEICTKIRELREKLGISKAEVARRAGISQSYYNEFELGKPKIKFQIDTLNSILEVLGTNISDFFRTDTEDMTVPEELKQYGLEEIRILKDAQITPDELKKALRVIRALESNRD